MGLGMYLIASRYLSGYEFEREREDPEVPKFDAVLEASGLREYISEDSPALEVHVNVCYWRKANAIHRWFIENVADGVDDCKPVYVSVEDLEKLLSLARKALETQDTTLLPTQPGFFFGSIEYDGWYWENIVWTITQLERILEADIAEHVEFYYRASW